VSSRQAFEALVADVYAPLQRYLRRRADASTAEDVLGDVLLVMWRRVADIPPEAPLAWCYGVARGCLANAQRGSQRQLKLVRRIAHEPAPLATEEDPDLERLGAAFALADLELDCLALTKQPRPAFGEDLGRVHEQVRAAVLGRQEAEAPLGVEPADGSLRHEELQVERTGGSSHSR
jgi:RNA polymerase sigma-70 factor (ECF subfamily)